MGFPKPTEKVVSSQVAFLGGFFAVQLPPPEPPESSPEHLVMLFLFLALAFAFTWLVLSTKWGRKLTTCKLSSCKRNRQ